MKSIVGSISIIGLLVAVLAIAQSKVDIQPRQTPEQTSLFQHYRVTDLGTLSGGSGAFYTASWLNRNGVSVGAVTLNDGAYHGVIWKGGAPVDLGTPGFGGPNSWAFSVNDGNTPAGYAETDTPDPYGEDFCGFKTHLVCHAFLWQNGAMSVLPTLGGNNSEALRNDNYGQVAGYAETATVDPNCPGPQRLQFEPVLWKNSQVQKLPMFTGDTEGFAWEILDKNQAVGSSGTCASLNHDGVYLREAHALSWQNGVLTNLGNLGGSGGTGMLGNAAYSGNSHGQVVGHSDLAGDTVTHAFLWNGGGALQDLGTLPGDVLSYAIDISDGGQIVGLSVSSESNYRAVVWENNTPVELNTLVVSGGTAGLYLSAAISVNAHGQIVGWGLTSGGDVHAYLANPVNSESATSALSPSPSMSPPVLSKEAREFLEHSGRLGGRFMPPQ